MKPLAASFHPSGCRQTGAVADFIHMNGALAVDGQALAIKSVSCVAEDKNGRRDTSIRSGSGLELPGPAKPLSLGL